MEAEQCFSTTIFMIPKISIIPTVSDKIFLFFKSNFSDRRVTIQKTKKISPYVDADSQTFIVHYPCHTICPELLRRNWRKITLGRKRQLQCHLSKFVHAQSRVRLPEMERKSISLNERVFCLYYTNWIAFQNKGDKFNHD